MKYYVTLDGQEREVEVVANIAGALRVTVDGVRLDGEFLRGAGGVVLKQGGRVLDIAVGPSGREVMAAHRDTRVIGSVQSERERARGRRKSGAGAAEQELRAPMPGRVVKVLVAAGEEVAAGQALLIMEAMKMENELRAEAPVLVDSVVVSEGQNVEADAVLMSFAPVETSA